METQGNIPTLDAPLAHMRVGTWHESMMPEGVTRENLKIRIRPAQEGEKGQHVLEIVRRLAGVDGGEKQLGRYIKVEAFDFGLVADGLGKKAVVSILDAVSKNGNENIYSERALAGFSYEFASLVEPTTPVTLDEEDLPESVSAETVTIADPCFVDRWFPKKYIPYSRTQG